MSGWHYRSEDGSEYGPLDDAEINGLAESGGLLLGTPVSHEDETQGEWIPAARIRELQERIPSDANHIEPESPLLLLLNWFARVFSTTTGVILSIMAFLIFTTVLLCGGSFMIRSIRAGAVSDSASETLEQADQLIAEGQEEQPEQQAEALARAQQVLDKFDVSFVKYSYSDAFYRNPIIELHVANNTEFAISRAHFKGRVIGKGRTIPYVEDVFDYRIPGGLEPGESAEWTIALNRYSEWAKIPNNDSVELVTTVVPYRLDGPNGWTVATNQP